MGDRVDLEKYITDASKLNNFFPKAETLAPRLGLERIPFKRQGLCKRFLRWWRGEPNQVNDIAMYNGVLYACSDRGLYSYDGKSMVRISFVEEQPNDGR